MELDTACLVTEIAEKHEGLSACYKFIKKHQRTPILTEMTYNDGILCGPQVIVDVLKKFFISVYNPLTNTAVEFCDCMFNNVNFELENVSSALSSAFMGTRIDHIPGNLFRFAAKLLCFQLLKLFGFITSAAIFLQRWKYAVITPVYKKRMKRCISSYRPINILPKFLLVFEKLVLKAETNYQAKLQ